MGKSSRCGRDFSGKRFFRDVGLKIAKLRLAGRARVEQTGEAARTDRLLRANVLRAMVVSAMGSMAKAPPTNRSLLARLRKANDTEAWSLFVDLYTPLVYRFARRRGLQDADASDVTQKVISRVYHVLHKFDYDPERGRFRDWLGTITHREVITHHRREARGQAAGAGRGDSAARRLPSGTEGDWLEEFNDYVLRAALARIRERFDEATWKAFDLTWLGNVETGEAARQLGKTAAWVYKARFRVLRRLREEVEFIAEDAAALQRPT